MAMTSASSSGLVTLEPAALRTAGSMAISMAMARSTPTTSASSSARARSTTGPTAPSRTAAQLTQDLTLQFNVKGGGLGLKTADVVVPEPSTLALVGIGAMGLLARRRKRS